MTLQIWLLPIAILVVTTMLALPLGRYLAWIMNGQYKAPKFFHWFEARLDSGPQNWKQYTVSILLFNSVLFLFGFAILALQPWMPLNPDGKGMLAPTTIFHSVVSFMTNTNLQHYSGDQVFSNFSQIFFCLTNFFLSASIGFCGSDGHHPRVPRRFAGGQLFRRYVAGGGLHVPALRVPVSGSSSCSRACR